MQRKEWDAYLGNYALNSPGPIGSSWQIITNVQ
jgi:hypothetical protein